MDEDPDKTTLRDWLTLLHAAAWSDDNLLPLLESFDSPRALISAAAGGRLGRARLSPKALECLRQPDLKEIDRELQWLEGQGRHLAVLTDERYPTLLKQIPAPPLALFVSGDPALLSAPQLAMVGSRRATPDGRADANHFSGELAQRGIVVTSGMAAGIDTEAHKGVLAQGGKTIAVLGGGLNCIYPRANLRLADKIRADGALVSEFPLSWKPYSRNFPRRNRIISGLCLGVIVVEAAHKSGSLITARHALEQNREVFAVPGSIRNPLKQGCHRLIRNGAKLAGRVEDILEEITPFREAFMEAAKDAPPPATPIGAAALDEQEKILLDNIGYEPTSLDEMVVATRLSIEDLTGRLLKLELDGLVTAVAPGVYARRPQA